MEKGSKFGIAKEKTDLPLSNILSLLHFNWQASALPFHYRERERGSNELGK
ncbi:uncharacterized protein G2W53_020670 [Senna tora]|uniref:Uncharacterized protein n=1 Tax=Senna tora TaxID=362788 RepID=A0A834TJZ6_9FABA|nr:uncharacterized protein G2W53_020670 [Senna tora]